MLWMGEEWGASTPWQFFTSHPEPELGASVAAGRREEFAAHGWTAAEVPDPQDPDTFRRSNLDWSEVDARAARRAAGLVPAADRAAPAAAGADRPVAGPGRGGVRRATPRWLVVTRGALRVAVNLAGERQEVPLDGTPMAVLLSSVPGFVYRAGAIELDAGVARRRRARRPPPRP